MCVSESERVCVCGWGCSGGPLVRTGGKWRKGMRSSDEGKPTVSFSPKFSFCPSTHHIHPPPTPTILTAPHSIYPHLSKMKNPSFSSNVQPNIIYTPFPKIESYLGGRRDPPSVFKFHSSMNFIFLATLDKIITRSIHCFSGHNHPSTYIFLVRSSPPCASIVLRVARVQRTVSQLIET